MEDIIIAEITDDGIIVFDLTIQSPWDWIDMMNDAGFVVYVGCYGGYENCLIQEKAN